MSDTSTGSTAAPTSTSGDSTVPAAWDTVLSASPNSAGSDDDFDFEIEEGKNTDGSKKTRKLTREEAKQFAQKGYGADAKFQEAAKAREETATAKRQMAQLARMFKEDPEQVMRAFEIDPDEWAMKRHEKKLVESKMSPHERENLDLKARMARFEEREAKEQADAKEKEVMAKAQSMQGQLFGRIEQVLTSAGVPKTPTTIAEIGRYLQQAHNAGKNIFEMPLETIVKHIQTRRQTEFNEVYGAYDDDALLNNVDPALLKRILNAHTKKMQGTQAAAVRRNPAPTQQVSSEERVQKSERQLQKEHDEKIVKMQVEWNKKNKNY